MRVHDSECVVCSRIVTGREVVAPAGWNGIKERTFSVRGFGLDCTSRNVVYMIKCRDCRKVRGDLYRSSKSIVLRCLDIPQLHVETSVAPLSQTILAFAVEAGDGKMDIKKHFQECKRVEIQVNLYIFVP